MLCSLLGVVIGFNHPVDVVRHHSCRVGAMDEDPCRQAPRTTDGKPNLSAPAPKRPDGTPDLSGVWTGPGGRFVQNLAADLAGRGVLSALGEGARR